MTLSEISDELAKYVPVAMVIQVILKLLQRICVSSKNHG